MKSPQPPNTEIVEADQNRNTVTRKVESFPGFTTIGDSF